MVTGHDKAGKGYFVSPDPLEFQQLPYNKANFGVAYTTADALPKMQNSIDIQAHKDRMASGKLGLVNPGGSVCRIVDFAPSGEDDGTMHRTRSLDYVIIINGTFEVTLGSDEKRVMRPGDICVQRGTSHAWRNLSETEWGRFFAVLLDSKPVIVDGKPLEEELGDLVAMGVPPSDGS